MDIREKDNGIDAGRIKSLRKKRGVKVSDIHKYLEVARSTYAGYEAGLRVPPPDKVKKIATYLDTTPDYLMGFSDDENPIVVQDDLKEIFTKNENLHLGGKKLSKEQKEQLFSIIDAYYSTLPIEKG